MSGPLHQGEAVERDGVLFYRDGDLVFVWAPGSEQIEMREADAAEERAYGPVLACLAVDALGVEFNLPSFREGCRKFLQMTAKAPIITEPQEGPPADEEYLAGPDKMVEEFGDLRFVWTRKPERNTIQVVHRHSGTEVAWLLPGIEFGDDAAFKARCMRFYRMMLETFGPVESDATAELDAEVPRVVASFEASLEAGSFDVELEVVQEGDRPRYGLLHSPEELDDLRLNAADAARLSRLFNAADEAIRTGVGSDLDAGALAELLSELELEALLRTRTGATASELEELREAGATGRRKLRDALGAAKGRPPTKSGTPDPSTPVEGSDIDWETRGLRGPAVEIIGRDRLFVFGTSELVQLLCEVAGAATRPLLEENPDYTFPSAKALEAIKQYLAHDGTQEDLSRRRLPGTVETEVVSEMVAYMCRRQQAVLRGVDPADLDLTAAEAKALIDTFMGGRPDGDALSSAHPKLEAMIAAAQQGEERS